ncbi:MAG: SAM-dependent methyltransferase [Bacteroidota bacterium]
MVFVFGLLLSTATYAQEDFDIPYVPTPQSVVHKMLDVANVGPGDYLIDLGSGDGRIVIEAVRRGAVGHGVEIESELVRKAEAKAREAGVSEKIMFLKEDVFETDFSGATVLTLYMMDIINLRLRPLLLEKLEPGTRIVSHSFGMKDWKPDKHLKEDDCEIFYWLVPSEIEGRWEWSVSDKRFIMTAEQEFQQLDIDIRAEGESLKVKEQMLQGKQLNFTAVHPDSNLKYVYHGEVEGETISGKVQIIDGSNETITNWSAKLK